MKCRVVYKLDGTVAVIHYAPKSKLSYEQAMEKCAAEAKLAGLPFDDIDVSALPQTRKYREAWRGSKGAGIHVDATAKAEIDARVPQPTVAQLLARIEALEARRVP